MRGVSANKYAVTCALCGAVFSAQRSTRQYCSPRCSMDAHNIRNGVMTPERVAELRAKNGQQASCIVCSKPFIAKTGKGGRIQRFCSEPCRMQFRKTNPPVDAAARNYLAKIKRVYDLSQEQYDGMYAVQAGMCAICHKKQPDGKRLAVDHDHDTGAVRGLLCTRCNFMMGWFDANAEEIIRYWLAR